MWGTSGVGYERFGRYVLHECLGAGGMAAVHRATVDIGGGVIREVALKRLLPQLADDKKLVDDFIREARISAQLHHPNIVRILELGRSAGVYFIAMELVQGFSLLQLMKLAIMQSSQTPIGVVVSLLVELCDALDYASNATDTDGEPLHIVHRDLSPSNLIVTDDGHLKVIDFGVAKALSGKFMTSSGMVKGKFGYMSIEALQGKPLDRRADIFSVGVVAWELVTGVRLFKAANDYDVVTLIQRGAREPPSAYNPQCPPELDEIVMRALAKSRDERWPNAAVMRRTLDSLRRTYRDGPQDVVAWIRKLVPPERAEETTSYELDSGEPDGPSIVVEPNDPFAEPSFIPSGLVQPIDEVSRAAADELSGSFASPLELSVSYAAPLAAQLGLLQHLDDSAPVVQIEAGYSAEEQPFEDEPRVAPLPEIPDTSDFSITPFIEVMPPVEGETYVLEDESILVTEAPLDEGETAFVDGPPFRDDTGPLERPPFEMPPPEPERRRGAVSRPPSTLAKRSKEQRLRDTVESQASDDLDATVLGTSLDET